jgi:putative transposase
VGKRVLVAVRLGQRERHEDWLDLGRDLARRGLRAPWLVVTDGAPGLIKAINELWPEADRQRCTVHYADLRIMPTSGVWRTQLAPKKSA